MRNIIIRILQVVVLIAVAVSFANAQDFVYFKKKAAAAGEPATACIGFPANGTDCDYSTAPGSTSSITGAAVATRARKWTASVAGTLSRVKVYYGTSTGTPTVTTMVYNGTTLVATGTVSLSNNTWVWSGALSAAGGQSLDFAQSDVLSFGFSTDAGAGEETVFGRFNDTTNENYWSQAAYLPDPHNLTENVNYQMGAILEYTYIP